MVQAKFFTVANIFEGEIKDTDLTLQEEELPEIQDGEYLVEALYLSVDPYMRAYARNYTIGQVMIGAQVGRVTQSKNPKFPVGVHVVGNMGWRTHTIVKPTDDYGIYIFPDIGHLPISLSLGALGLTGNSAYFGFLDICQPQEGDTVVVSGAGGAVGSHVGQIAKIKDCRVIGITGSDEKAKWLETIGFDYVINYKKTPNIAEELKKAAPKGVDCYFDNVGGDTSSAVLNAMNLGGRVSVCGSISAYNAKSMVRAPIVQPAIIQKQLTLKGFHALRFMDRWFEGIEQNLKWIQEGRLKYKETFTEGFENTLEALKGVMKGQNTGKAVVRVATSHVENESVDFAHALNKFKKFQK